MESNVFGAGTETPLEHGIGVGLWVTDWAMQELGGERAVLEPGSEGTDARVGAPPVVTGGARTHPNV